MISNALRIIPIASIIVLATVGRAQSLDSALALYPMHIEDTWTYDVEEVMVARYYTYVTIIGDTLMPNGQRYFVWRERQSNNGTQRTRLRRMDSSAACIYVWDDHYVSEARAESLLAKPGDSFSRGASSWWTPNLCTSQGTETIFGQPVAIKTFSATVSYSYALAHGLGLTRWSSDPGEGFPIRGSLVYCKINGVSSGTPVSVPDFQATPMGYGLLQNYPNPFNPTTTISYSLPEPSFVRIAVFNSLGQQVTLLRDDFNPAGVHTLNWTPDSPSGVYYYRLNATSTVRTHQWAATRTMILVK